LAIDNDQAAMHFAMNNDKKCCCSVKLGTLFKCMPLSYIICFLFDICSILYGFMLSSSILFQNREGKYLENMTLQIVDGLVSGIYLCVVLLPE